MSKFFTFLRIYLFVFITFTLGFFISFKLPIFKNNDILFIRGIKLLIVLFLVYQVGLIWFIKKRTRYIESFFSALFIVASVCFSFLVLVPVTVDRSISTYVLDKISKETNNKNNVCIKEQILYKKFIEEYVENENAIGRRLNEQIVIGTIEADKKKCWRLTQKGRLLNQFFKTVGDFFGDGRK